VKPSGEGRTNPTSHCSGVAGNCLLSHFPTNKFPTFYSNGNIIGCFYYLLSASKHLLAQNCSSLAFIARGDCWEGGDPKRTKTGAETSACVPLLSLITGVGCGATFEFQSLPSKLLSVHLPTAQPVCSGQRAAPEQFAVSLLGWER